MNREVTELLKNYPIVPAVKGNDLSSAIESPCKVIFMLNTNILTVAELIEKAHCAGKKVYVHIDLAEGIGKDVSGIKFLKKCGADGIISTKVALIRMANEQGLVTVQRVFALDSKGLISAAETVKAANPDFTEVLPGVVHKAIKQLTQIRIPVIAGGLISEKSEVSAALEAGAVAVSTGKKELWNV